MNNVKIIDSQIYFSRSGEAVKLSPCGKNAIRFQSSPNCKILPLDYTLMPQKVEGKASVENNKAVLEVGTLRAELYPNGKVCFFKEGKLILEEKPDLCFHSGFRRYNHIEGDLWKAKVMFKANENEHFFGLGHEESRPFDLKGSTVDIRNINAKCTIPYVYSSLGYGFLWNLPSTGLCELSNNHTRWTSDSLKQVDYLVIGGTPRETAGTLADLTGHSPMMPQWAMGFWQCRLRYESQEMLLEVARKYKQLGIPLSVIVADYFHWTEQGEYKFDPKYWPDVKAMTDELHQMGTRLMVSVWPTVNPGSENFRYMWDNNMLIRTTKGQHYVFDFYGPQREIDATNPETREFVWSKIKENYIDNGVDLLWFDEAEPEINPVEFENLLFYTGKGDEVGLLYPYYYTKMAYDGLKSIGRDDIITLSRCAYTGAQRFGALVWSGDIPSTFESLENSVWSGLNMSMCGITWWNTDIGGFWGADTDSYYFKELIVRWFQYGVFCPVTRLHGNRGKQDWSRGIKEPTGAENEIWSFGEENFRILKDLILLRERLKPYITKHMKIASKEGVPIMRPTFFDYPDDENCYKYGEQFFFGDDILFAPVTKQGATHKEVYLPEGKWVLTKNKKEYDGGRTYNIEVKISEFVAFTKKGADVLKVF
ncbi:MAG: TIM-barrel domain-containing protein [Acutalibacteraceae bacterium]